MDRRRFLTVFAAGGGLASVLSACDQTPASAIAPWTEAVVAPPQDLRLRCAAWALLAPNPHNLQPWRLDLTVPDQVTLRVNAERRLPATDPFDRQILIGLGAFVELFDIAASAAGYRAEVIPFPDGQNADRLDQRPIALIRLQPDRSRPPDPLFSAIPRRRSSKVAYQPAPIDPTTAAKLAAAASGITVTSDPAMIADLRGLTIMAHRIEAETPRTFAESVRWMRIGADEIARDPDGIRLNGTIIWWLNKTGMLTRETLRNPNSFAFKQGLAALDDVIAATPTFGWLETEGNDRQAQFTAGRRYARLDLSAAALGVAIHPLSQALEEYAEMVTVQADLNRRLGILPDRRIQMLVRLGTCELPPPTPRWPVSAIVET